MGIAAETRSLLNIRKFLYNKYSSISKEMYQRDANNFTMILFS